MRFHQTVCLLFIFLIAFGSVPAQSPNGTISGLVIDPAGGVIVRAEITVINDATGVQYAAKTNGDGIYLVPDLPPGAYRIQVAKVGFKTIIKPDITLNVLDALAINFTLPLGAVSEIVTVPGGAPLVNTEDSAVSTIIDRNFAANLPLNGRSFNTLLQLTPGVTIVPSQGTRPGQFSINGQRTNANSFQVDGVSVNFGSSPAGNLAQNGGGGTQAFNAYGGTSSLVSVDALQEFRVETSSYAPEFGQTPGGQVSISTRSGTNQFHGDAFNYFRNDVLDANDWFADAAGKPRAAERQNDFGGVLGGPIWRQRTFFFVSYEGLRLRQPAAGVTQVPSLLWRASAIPAAATILNGYPKPAGNAAVSPDGDASPFTGVWSNPISSDAGSVRIDHVLSSRLFVFGRYNRSPSQSSSRFPSADSLSTVFDTAVDTTSLTFGSTWLLSGNVSNSSRFNYSRQTASLVNRLDNFGGATPPPASVLIPAGGSVNDSLAVFNPILIGNPQGSDLLTSLALGVNGKNKVVQWNVVDDLSVTEASHRVKFGVNYRRLPIAQTGHKFSINYLAAGPSLGGPADPAAQFASTANVSVVLNNVNRPTDFAFQSFSAYAQDGWKLSRRVSLTYGLRWEFSAPPTGQNGTVLAAWQNVDSPAQLAIAPIGSPVWNATYGNFAPRVGIAWQPAPNGDLVVRGGWGIFYDLGTGPAANLGFDFPNSATFSSFPGTPGPFPVPIANAASITPSVSLQGPYVSNSFLAGIAPNLALPYSQQWNVAIEKSLWTRQVLSLTYVGQIGRRLLRTEAIPNPNANFKNSTFTLTRNGDTSDYHALQVQFRRPLSQSVQALVNYTWSHSIDTSSDDTLAGISHFALGIAGERGSSNFDVRHQVSGAVTYELPEAKSNRLWSNLIGNWSLDAVFQARTGFPLNIYTTRVSIPGLANFVQTRPDLVAGAPIWIIDSSAPGGERLNAAAFALPATARQGTLGRNAFAGFGATQVDTSVRRAFAFSERLNLQFRADVFNVFNHPNFSTADPFGQFPAGPTFGRATQMLNRGLGGLNALYQIGGPRSMQLSLKLQF